jgi:hypothetical protein
MKSTVELLKKYFRSEDLVGRLCDSKLIILALSEEIPQETIKFKLESIVIELKKKYPFICSEDIVWKHIYMDPGEDIFKKFTELKSIKYNNIVPVI